MTSPKLDQRPRGERGGVILILVVILLLIVLGIVGYVWVTLHWSYSDGQRAGVVQKLSHKGWVCKTWEGELAMSTVPGVAPVIWSFSVRDSKVADQIGKSMGRRVSLHYTEHHGVPTSCFAETNYFDDGVQLTE